MKKHYLDHVANQYKSLKIKVKRLNATVVEDRIDRKIADTGTTYIRGVVVKKQIRGRDNRTLLVKQYRVK